MNDKNFLIILGIIAVVGFYNTILNKPYKKEEKVYMKNIIAQYKDNIDIYCFSEHYRESHPPRVIPYKYNILNNKNKDLILNESKYWIKHKKDNRYYEIINCSKTKNKFKEKFPKINQEN